MGAGVDIVIIKKTGLGDPGVGPFGELAETLVFALRRLGFAADVAYNRFSRSRPLVVFGAHELTADEMARLPASAVIYNLEQIGSGSGHVGGHYLDLLRRAHVWDYSRRNVEALARAGIAARLVPVGHVAEMSRIPAGGPQPIDVLFYGAVNARRRAVLDALGHAGLEVVCLQNYYGRLRDAVVARSKLVLNMHYYEAGIFEIVRVSHLLSNRRAVVAERHPDTEVEPDLLDAVAFAPYEGLVEACRALAADGAARERLAETGWRRMAARDAVRILREAVVDLGLEPP